jgi:hypothetical protein
METCKHEEDLYLALEIIVNSQIFLEKLESLQLTMYNKQKIKSLVKQLIPCLEEVANRDYNKIFEQNQDFTLNVVYEYDSLIKRIARRNFPQNIELSQILASYDLDRKTMEATAHRIIKKHSK